MESRPVFLPGTALDVLLTAAGKATWAAGPLIKGSNLWHGTSGNVYALLKLFEHTGNAMWLDRARAVATHGIAQMEADAVQVGQMRYSLWTGDLGFAIYLWVSCVAAQRFRRLTSSMPEQAIRLPRSPPPPAAP